MLPLWLNCSFASYGSEPCSSYTLYHFSSTLYSWITRLALNQHQRAQSPPLNSQAVSKGTASPCGIWNGTGFSVEMLAGNIVKECWVCFNNGLPCQPYQKPYLHVMPSRRFRTKWCIYISEKVTNIKEVPLSSSTKPSSFNDNLLGRLAHRHIDTEMSNSG